MNTAVATTQPRELAPTPLDVLLADPEKLAAVPVETMERLFALQREARADAARDRFHEAFHALQGELTPVRKAAHNKHTKSWYARIEDVNAMLDPLLHKHGFSVSLSSRPGAAEDHTRFVLVVRHSGHVEEHFWDAPIDDKGIKGETNKTRLHGGGSSMTYAERYLKTNVFNIQTFRDDDGNAAGTGPGAQKITKAQFEELNALFDEVGGDKQRFCNTFEVAALAELTQANFPAARNMLIARRGRV